MDYVTQQNKLFPYIATCYAFQFVANWLWDVYNNITNELESGQLDNLPEVCMVDFFLIPNQLSCSFMQYLVF